MRYTRQLPLIALTAVLALAAVVLSACGGGSASASASPTSVVVGKSQYRGALVSPALPKPTTVLTDTSGQPFDMQKQTQGYVTLLYFGYTNCPDACPQTMSNLQAAFKQLPPDVISKIKVLFVTTDPKRDTPQVLRTWLSKFNPSFIGLVGTDAQINDAMAQVDIPPVTTEDLGNGNYAVSHAAYVMAYTTDNIAHIVYPDGVSVADWVHDLNLLVKQGFKNS